MTADDMLRKLMEIVAMGYGDSPVELWGGESRPVREVYLEDDRVVVG